MGQSKSALVVDQDGARGTIEVAAQPVINENSKVIVLLDNGQRINLAAGALVDHEDGTFFVPYSFAQQRAVQSGSVDGQIVLPVIEETLEVQKREVETGRVRVTKKVHEREEVVDEPLMEEEVSVTRVDINRVVEGPVAVRHEGDTMIIPVIQEQVVLQKKLLLVEEIHVTKQMVETHRTQKVTLLREEVEITRIAGNENPGNSNIGN